MKICAVICEFNPLHNGHKYLLDKIREQGFERIVCFMSGNFVQRAEPACADKYERAECAIKCGADAVFELPVLYATANAQVFAYGGIRLISAMGIDNIAFGIESADTQLIIDAAKLQSDESEEFRLKLKDKLAQGISYPAALSLTTTDILNEKYPNCQEELSKPNNVLAISYLRASHLVGKKINPIMIKRQGADYNDTTLESGKFPSATALRNYINKDGKNTDFLRTYMPIESISMNSLGKVDYKLFEKLLIHTLRCTTKEQIATMPDAGEGIEIKLLKNALQYTELTDVIEATKSKRYTYARIKRLCLQVMLGINNDLDLSKPVSRLLAIKKDSLDLIKNLPSEFYVKVSELENKESEFATIEQRADSLYYLLSGTDGNPFYSTKLNIVETQ
ncbi:MAG: nucleotidyltransferase family protein [Clostridia bacterium]|nr:nucleotidyltransferase family protein [Clostridia bacterium]